MADFKSKETVLNANADAVYKKLSNLEGLGKMLSEIPEDKVPADQKEMLAQVKVTPDSISFPAGPAGNLTMKLAECVEPTLIRLEGVDAPVPMSMSMHIFPIDDHACQAQVEVNLQIPAMLKPMVSGPLNKLVEQFAQMLHNIPFE